jgi:hypothetical protein
MLGYALADTQPTKKLYINKSLFLSTSMWWKT